MASAALKIGIHARQDNRFLCPVRRKTCSATTGTACSRLRTAAETVALVVTVLAHGCPVHAMVAACGCDERTVAEGTVDHCCTPHASVPHTSGGTTPAMAAGITDHGWAVQELLSLHVPPPRWTPPKQRGRPSHAFKRLIERWCGDHG